MKKTAQFPFYKVEFYNGQFDERKDQEQITIFKQDDLLEARKDALLFAFAKEENPDHEPTLLKKKPYQRLTNMISLDIAVLLIVSKTEEYQIFGDQVHENLSGLNAEACYLIKKKLITPNQLLKVWQNNNEADGEHPFEMNESKLSPEKEYIQIEVVNQQFRDIMERSLVVDGFCSV